MKKYDDNNTFAKILRQELPCNKVFESETVLAFHTIQPLADIHVLVIPKKPLIDYEEFIKKCSTNEIVEFFQSINIIASKLKISEYRLVTNCGKTAGQEIQHFHMHMMHGNIK